MTDLPTESVRICRCGHGDGWHLTRCTFGFCECEHFDFFALADTLVKTSRDDGDEPIEFMGPTERSFAKRWPMVQMDEQVWDELGRPETLAVTISPAFIEAGTGDES